jgi:hypothetical protein
MLSPGSVFLWKEKTFTTKYTKKHEGDLKKISVFFPGTAPVLLRGNGVLKIKEFDLLRVTLCPSWLKLFGFKTLSVRKVS